MTEISPRAQALIDRLARMDPVRPRRDKAAIEDAITAHLVALAQPERQFIWARDARIGMTLLDQRPAGAALDEAWRDAFDKSGDARCDLIGSDIWDGVDAAARAAFDAAWRAARGAAWDDLWDALPHNDPDSALRNLIWLVPLCAEGNMAAKHALFVDRGALWAVDMVATWEAIRKSRDEEAIASLPEEWLSIWLPFLDAFEAGLHVCWITPVEVVCALQPPLSIARGRLHCADGPAVRWASGARDYFWRGVAVPSWVIEELYRITPDAIRNEPNPDIRRSMTEISDPWPSR